MGQVPTTPPLQDGGRQFIQKRRRTAFAAALQNRDSRGVALVITLMMLAMVTVMAIIFLALARAERRSVKIVEDLETAKVMSAAGLERAKAQTIATMAASGSKLNYDLSVSTNFYNYGGYDRNTTAFDPANVSYTYPDGSPVKGNDLPLIQGIALIFCVLMLAITVIVDVLYAVLNPRLRTL